MICMISEFAEAPPVAKIFVGRWPIHCECRRIENIWASTTARQFAAASVAERFTRRTPGLRTRGVISGSNHGIIIAPLLPGGVVRNALENSGHESLNRSRTF